MGAHDPRPEATPDEIADASSEHNTPEDRSKTSPDNTGTETAQAGPLALPRRSVLGALASLGLLGVVSEPASAHHTQPSVSDSGTIILKFPDDLNFGQNLSVTDDGDNTVTIDASSTSDGDGTPDGDGNSDGDDSSDGGGTSDGEGGKWNDSDGDSLLEPNSGFAGIDTTDRANGRVVTTKVDTAGTSFTLETGTTDTGDAQNVVQGHASNEVKDGVVGATISGGGRDDGSNVSPNEVVNNYGTIAGGLNNRAGGNGGIATVGGGYGNTASGPDATVSGGEGNTASDSWTTVGGGTNNTASARRATVSGGKDNVASDKEATVGGGEGNTASGWLATVGGGTNNTASNQEATIGGGQNNVASGINATVGGGFGNEASADDATIPGGDSNTADGAFSFAAGRVADTNGFEGAFVLGDSSGTPINAQNADEVRSQMPMYAPSFNTTSARAVKTNIESVDSQEALAGVTQLEIKTWELADIDDGKHIGPMAEDFHQQFALDGDDETIATVDADGVALAAIQGLSAQLDSKDERIDELEATTKELETENKALRKRLDALEERVASVDSPDAVSTPAHD